jgi:hypothetical protein
MAEAAFSTFVMSETTRNQIKVLPQEMQLKFFWAVMDFGLDGVEPDFGGIELALWIPMRDLILSSKRKDEAWHDKQRQNGKKGGRPRKTQKPKITHDNPNIPGVFDETQITQGFSDENPKTHNENENDNVNSNDNENGNEECPFLPVSDNLNSFQKNLVSRVEGRRKKWVRCKLPPAPIITNMNVLNDLNDCFRTYPDEKIDEAITNFAGVISQPGFDVSTLPGGHKPNFKNFLLRWVDTFIDEAKPFEAYKTKQGTSPPAKGPDWGGKVNMGKGVKPKQFFGGGKDG